MNPTPAKEPYRDRMTPRELIVVAVAALGAAALFFHLEPFVLNVVTYQVQPVRVPMLPQTLLIPALAVVAVAAAAQRMIAGPRGSRERPAGDASLGLAKPSPRIQRVADFAPFLIPPAVAVYWQSRDAPDFVSMCLAFVAIALAVDRCGRWGGRCAESTPSRMHGAAPFLLAAAIAASTLWHAAQQHRFWQHFMLGFADFGPLTIELEHCLPWKQAGPWRFCDSWLQWHAIFMFYALAPFYALFRSPVFLMVVGPLMLNLASVPFYQLARRRSGSPAVGLLVALAWLALPSVSRLPYSNTYGFHPLFMAVPWLAFAFSLAFTGRWAASHVCLVGAALCEETTCGVVFGWGLYLALFSRRRRDGLIIAAASIAYLLLCTMVVIPSFHRTGEYTRLELFGDLFGAAPVEAAAGVIERLTRPRAALYVLALFAPLLPSLLRRWKLIVAALPTLLLILLVQQPDYLNLKFWHHTHVPVVLFTAAALGATAERRREGMSIAAELPPPSGEPLPPPPPAAAAIHARAWALLAGALLFHHALGMSPLSKLQRLHHYSPTLTVRDPRLDIVAAIRDRFDPSQYAVIATERMAAHFMDYQMVMRVRWIDPSALRDSPILLVFDRSDGWDDVVSQRRSEEFLSQARAAGFEPVFEDGTVAVLVRDTLTP